MLKPIENETVSVSVAGLGTLTTVYLRPDPRIKGVGQLQILRGDVMGVPILVTMPRGVHICREGDENV